MSPRATIDDIHATALGMPHVTAARAGTLPIYQVGGTSFVFFRTPRSDAVDPDTGKRYDDVIVFWVASDGDKLALVQDETTPFFTTPHFDGHPSVLRTLTADLLAANCRRQRAPLRGSRGQIGHPPGNVSRCDTVRLSKSVLWGR